MNRGEKKPDFIICGAMKTGTTTLHHLLDQQDAFFLPNCEVHYFCAGDLSQHFPYRGRSSSRWYRQSYGGDELKQWYSSHFDQAKEGQLIGEDSTVYMASSLAPARIRDALPDVKLIFVLRNPVDRLWSHYWHLVRSGRAMYGLDRMLEIQASSLLVRGHYKEQIERYKLLFPENQLKFILLEDIKSKPHAIVSEIAQWLGHPLGVEGAHFTQTHFHRGRYPRSLRMQLWRNRLLQGLDRRLYQNHYPEVIEVSDLPTSVLHRLIEKLFIKVNPHDGVSSTLDHSTREMLGAYYCEQNNGLGELIGRAEVDLWH
ncbi:sulfotransferase domain-containing protein [Akkermansiaceae bacterium]|nr:sulfotransferase domain-containing protein [Akkermansiaceae bacterium]